MAYANPHFKAIDARKWQCNICSLTQERPERFWNQELCPELNYGTYEFVAPKEYVARPAQDPIFFIVIETTASSVGTLALPQVILNSVKSLLDVFPFPQRSRVGVVSFGAELVFYKPSKRGDVIEVVVNDILDPFVPDHPSALSLQVTDDREIIEGFFDSLIVAMSTRQSSSALSMASVCTALTSLLAPTGGRALIFSTLLGTTGLHPLRPRDDPKLYSTDREKELLMPQAERYSGIGREAAEKGICFDFFLLGSSYQDVASVFALASESGGDVQYYYRFSPVEDNERIHFAIANILVRPQAFAPLMRARCSNQLSVAEYIGHYTRKGPMEMIAGAIDADKSICVMLSHDEKMTQGTPAYIQCAVLYASLDGRWLLRVFNGIMTPYLDISES
jgi:protein transport protein SEC24